MQSLVAIPPREAWHVEAWEAVTVQQEGVTAVVTSAAGHTWEIRHFPGIVCIQWRNGRGLFHEAVQPHLGVTAVGLPLSVKPHPDGWVVEAGAQAVMVSRSGVMQVETAEGIRFRWHSWAGWGTSRMVACDLSEREAVLGLGEKTGGLDKRGRRWTQWATDVAPHYADTDPLYQAIPVMVMAAPGAARGVFLANTSRSYQDLTRPDHAVLAVDEGPLTLYCYLGPTLAHVLEQHTRMTGRPALPPRWALGWHQSRWSYGDEATVRRIVEEYRRRQIPLDAVYLDIDYMDRYHIFHWNAERFPDPPTLLADMAREGVHLVTIVDPGVAVDPSDPVYQSGMARDIFLRYANGRDFESRVWPGLCVFPDFLNPEGRAWWADQVAAWAQQGLDGLWIDMNEPALFGREEGRPEAGGWATDAGLGHRDAQGAWVPHTSVHNVYALLEAVATREGLKRAGVDRPFVLSRAGFAGIQQVAAVWTGDNHSWWEHLALAIPMCLNLGLSGVPFVGPDIGGFNEAPSPELFARWVAMGAFFPFARIHTSRETPAQEPWAFGPEVEAISRRYISWRYRLLPYWETLFEEAHRTGSPVMRPLFWEFPEDAESYRVTDEFLVGSELLVAPVTQPGAGERAVYLPETWWYDIWEKRVVPPGWHQVAAPWDRLPLFVRAGGVLPFGPAVTSTQGGRERWTAGEDGPSGLWMVRGSGQLVVYSDDGETNGYQQGLWRRLYVTVREAAEGPEVELRGEWPDAVAPWQTRLECWLQPFDAPPRSVTVDGEAAPWRWEPDQCAVVWTMPKPVDRESIHVKIVAPT
ncbi:MAG: alpha-glucosidase [Firmicutes bacterium]|nr:alpha-glucosidase [Bacillota bacterium]